MASADSDIVNAAKQCSDATAQTFKSLVGVIINEEIVGNAKDVLNAAKGTAQEVLEKVVQETAQSTGATDNLSTSSYILSEAENAKQNLLERLSKGASTFTKSLVYVPKEKNDMLHEFWTEDAIAFYAQLALFGLAIVIFLVIACFLCASHRCWRRNHVPITTRLPLDYKLQKSIIRNSRRNTDEDANYENE